MLARYEPLKKNLGNLLRHQRGLQLHYREIRDPVLTVRHNIRESKLIPFPRIVRVRPAAPAARRPGVPGWRAPRMSALRWV